MTIDAELAAAHGELLRQYDAMQQGGGERAADAVATQLALLKLMLTERELLFPALPQTPDEVDALVVARGVFEIGTLFSIHQKDTSAFDRYWSQLKPFYLDVGDHIPRSANYEPLVGLSLLRLLSSNQISAFHMALETLPADLVRDSKYIHHPVLLERWLMEGSYSNVWRERESVPREEFRFFVDKLMVTIREEIARCEEKAYASLPLKDVATLLFFDHLPEVLEFAKERGWHVSPTIETIEFSTKNASDENDEQELVPMRSTITSNLRFARELESIV
ncbi:regulatory particle non-ATPase [Malassezia sp. CBS 17886]|nr:regulatory particle non-ATPase [Malassezia sp. CBS 17886]